SDGTSAQAVTTTSAAMTVSAVTPSQGTTGATVPVTIDGSGFVSGATVSAGAGITVSNVAFVSSARLTASFAIDTAATAGPRDVTVANPNGSGGSLSSGFTVSVQPPVTLTFLYNGKLRDVVGGGDTWLAADAAADGTMTLTLSAARAVTAATTSAVTVSAVTPNQGTTGTTVPVTIDGSGFVNGATVSAGAGITVSNITLVSSARLTASFVIDGSTTAGRRDVMVTNPD